MGDQTRWGTPTHIAKAHAGLAIIDYIWVCKDYI